MVNEPACRSMCWLNGPKCLCGSGSVNVTPEVLKAYYGTTTFQACHEVHELVAKYNGMVDLMDDLKMSCNPSGILSYTPIWRAPLQLSNTYFILGNDLLSEKHQDAMRRISKLVCGYKDMWKLLYQLKKYPDHASHILAKVEVPKEAPDLSFVYNTLYEDVSVAASGS